MESKTNNISKEDLEIEIKIQVKDISGILRWLNDNATFIKEINLEDHYFESKYNPFIFIGKNNFKDANEWLRVRFTDKGDSICYKNCHKDENEVTLYLDEIETGVEDGIKVMNLLKSLGYNEISIIKKNRKSYKYNDYQFDLDDIENLGFFIEIEFQGEIEDLNTGREQLNKFIKSIGIEKYKQINSGYPQMVWNDEFKYIDNE